MLLDDYKAGPKACQAVLERQITGKILVQILRSTEATTALSDELCIESAITRITLQHLAKRREATPYTKYTRAPEIPHEDKGIPRLTEFREYGVAIQGWLALYAKKIAVIAGILFSDPTVDLKGLSERLTDKDKEVDAVWAMYMKHMEVPCQNIG